MPTLEQRLMGKVVWSGDEDECWIWEGAKVPKGYGQIRVDEKAVPVHRAAYELFVGPIPLNLHLDHTCHNNDSDCPGGPTCLHRACVNPAHLEPVTCAENIRRGKTGAHAREKTHCKRGHPLSGDNLYAMPDGRRGCRECRREAVRRYRARP